MKKVKIIKDEWYPVYEIDKEEGWWGYSVEIEEKDLAWIEKVFNEFKDVQEFLINKTKGETL